MGFTVIVSGAGLDADVVGVGEETWFHVASARALKDTGLVAPVVSRTVLCGPPEMTPLSPLNDTFAGDGITCEYGMSSSQLETFGYATENRP